MSKWAVVSVVCVAIIAGFIGGYAGYRIARMQEVATAPVQEGIRATRFELINGQGKTLALLSQDRTRGDVNLTFFDEHGTARTKIGTVATAAWSDYSPLLAFSAKDGRERYRVLLNEFDKPLMVMSGPEWGGTMLLGHDVLNDQDYGPRKDLGTWGIAFSTPSRRSKAWLVAGRTDAFLVLGNADGKFVATAKGVGK